jgi:hypothetical protein
MKNLLTLFLLLLAIPGFNQVNTPHGDLMFADTLEFDPTHSWISISDPESCIWEIGQPDKNYFDQPLSGNKAMLTDSSTYYGSNLNDVFMITIAWEEHYIAEGILSFFHKYDTDYKTDGGIVEISYDEGESWINLHEEGESYDRNFIGLSEDTIQGGEYAFSGKSDGWQYVELQWVWMVLTKKDLLDIGEEVFVRFRFVSDDIDTQKEGWMIDDIVFRGYSASGDIEGHALSRVLVYPNPASDLINFKFTENDGQNHYIHIYSSLGQEFKSLHIEKNQLDITDMSNGIYFYEIRNEKEVVARGKFLKQ